MLRMTATMYRTIDSVSGEQAPLLRLCPHMRNWRCLDKLSKPSYLFYRVDDARQMFFHLLDFCLLLKHLCMIDMSDDSFLPEH